MPLERDIENVFGLIPLANAFKESSSITLIFGVVIPVAMHRFSTILYTLLLSFRARGLESVAALIIAECENHAIVNHTTTPTIINGAIIKKLWFIWLMVLCSSEFKDKKKKKSHVKTKKTTGNITNMTTELVLFLHIWLCKPKYFILSELDLRRLFCFCPLITKFKHRFAFEIK